MNELVPIKEAKLRLAASPEQVLLTHVQKSQSSCAASGMEMILKIHGLIDLEDFSLQSKYGDKNIGFEQIHELEAWGLSTFQKQITVPELVDFIEQETAKGLFPLISLPVHREMVGGQLRIYFHIHIASRKEGSIQVLDPASGHSFTGQKTELSAVLGYCLKNFGLPVDYRLDCLSYNVGNLGIK